MHLKKNKQKQLEIKHLLTRYTSQLLKNPFVRDVGVGFRIEDHHLSNELSIIIETNQPYQASAVAPENRLPEKIEGIPVSLIAPPIPEVVFESMEDIHPLIQEIAKSRNQEFAQLIGGIRIRNGWKNGYGGGTLGAVVYDRKSNEPFGLTSRHVLISDRRWVLKRNFPVIHPDRKWSPDTEIGTIVKRGRKDMDCVRFPIHSHREIDPARSVLGLEGLIKGIEQEIICGTKVMKSGSRTGVTYGVIVCESVCKNRFIVFPDDDYELIDGELTLGGDSGSIWLLNDGSMRAIGLHCLGNKSKEYDAELGVALKMAQVAEYLNIRF